MSMWGAAQAAFEIAREAEDSYDRATWRPAYHAAERGGPGIPAAIDAECERLTDARCEAEDMLIATPAPSLPAMRWKIEYARKRWENEGWPASWWEAVLGDLRRLAA